MLHSAFRRIIQHIDFIISKSPSIKSNPVGIFFYDELSFYRPENIIHRKRLINNYRKPLKAEKLVLLEADYKTKPYNRREIYTKIRIEKPLNEKYHIAFYIPFLGVIPEELTETYPLSQHELPRPQDITGKVNELSAEVIIDYVVKHGYIEVLIEKPKYYQELIHELIRRLKERNIKFSIVDASTLEKRLD